MAHILIVKSKNHEHEVKRMLYAAIDIIISNGHTYDEIQVSTVKDFPIALNIFNESGLYEATLCIGILQSNPYENSTIHYQEITRCIYDYSTYFGHLVGQSIIYCENKLINDLDYITDYARDVAVNMCDFIRLNRELNSIDGTRYGNSTLHN